MDYGDVIIHLFHKDTRGFYGLERLWGDADKLELETILKEN
jgi:ribosome-associated protein